MCSSLFLCVSLLDKRLNPQVQQNQGNDWLHYPREGLFCPSGKVLHYQWGKGGANNCPE